MSAQELSPAAFSGLTTERRIRSKLRRNIAAALHALAAGMAASKDYRHLNAMTKGQFGRIGLTRDGIPREIYMRHFSERPDLVPGSPHALSGDSL